MTIQLKPYLDIRPMGSSLHVGLVPPSAVCIEDPPDCLAPLLAYLREARDEDDVIAFLAGYGIEAPVAMDLLDQLTDAELVSTPISACSTSTPSAPTTMQRSREHRQGGRSEDP
jgi:hypothetical protein